MDKTNIPVFVICPYRFTNIRESQECHVRSYVQDHAYRMIGPATRWFRREVCYHREAENG